MPEPDELKAPLPTIAINLGDGFALLRKCDKYLISPKPEILTAIQDYLKQPNKPVYRALGNPTRGKVTSQSDCRR